MKFSKTELGILSSLGDGYNTIKQIAEALGLSTSQIYRSVAKLQEKIL
ncbi:MAG: winged helix-turn-helix transcriptional regulator [Candidatus Woesearchaeota archaeon]